MIAGAVFGLAVVLGLVLMAAWDRLLPRDFLAAAVNVDVAQSSYLQLRRA